MKASIEILTTPTADTPGTSLMLHFDDKTYIIGHVHEGCQRAIVSRQKRVVKVTDTFLTGRIEWKNIGGLLGLIITAADSKTSAKSASDTLKAEKRERAIEDCHRQLQEVKSDVKRQKIQEKLDRTIQQDQQSRQEQQDSRTHTQGSEIFMGIHGGRNLLHTIAASRRFIFRKGVPLRVFESDLKALAAPNNPTWSDKNVQVFSVPVLPEGVIETAEKNNQNQEMLESVVSNMFDSDWKMDALFEAPLAEVPMPAAIFIRNPDTHKIEKWTGPKPGDIPKEDLPKVTVLVRKPWPAARIEALPPTTQSQMSTSYIFKTYQRRGKFLPDEAKRLGVAPRQNKILTSGQEVVLEDGTVVKPEQVMEPSRAGRGFAVIDIPDPSYIQQTLARPEWTSSELMEGVCAVFWILGSGVVSDATFTDFVKSMDKVEHIISSPEHTANYFAMTGAAALELRLACINSQNFPPLQFNNDRAHLPEVLRTESCHLAHPGQILDLEPTQSWDESEEAPSLNCAQVIDHLPKKVKKLSRAISEEIKSAEVQRKLNAQALPGAEAEIITLGTGSSQPAKYRNVSSTLVRVPGYGSYMFDAGENTLGQLARIFSTEELQEVLRDLRMIWISHLHADHHLGITSVIKAWHETVHGSEARNQLTQPRPSQQDLKKNVSKYIGRDKLFVVSDNKMLHWLSEYSQVENFGLDKVIPVSVKPAAEGHPSSTGLAWGETPLGFNTLNVSLDKAMREASGLVDIQAARVSHCAGALAVALSFADGFKVSYSGDCRPSKRFVEIGKGSTLLIHEATFEDELIGDALAKKHSTTSEAIKVGIEMGAPRILLTHFSQRYAKVPNVRDLDNFKVLFQDASGEVADDGPVDNADDVKPVAHREMNSGESSTPARGREGSNTIKEKSSGKKHSQLGANDKYSDVKIGVAFDYMRVKVKDIAALGYYTPAINALTEHFYAVQNLPSQSEDSEGSGSPRKRKRQEDRGKSTSPKG